MYFFILIFFWIWYTFLNSYIIIQVISRYPGQTPQPMLIENSHQKISVKRSLAKFSKYWKGFLKISQSQLIADEGWIKLARDPGIAHSRVTVSQWIGITFESLALF